MHMSECLHKDSIGPVSFYDKKLTLGKDGFVLESGKSLPVRTVVISTQGKILPQEENILPSL